MLLSTTDNAFCVEYYLVKGTDEHIVDATIKSDSLGAQTLPAVNIEASTEVCYSDIAASTWTLYGCDGGSTSCDSSNAAVSITGIVVNGTLSIVVSSPTPTGTPTTTSKHNIIYLHDVYFIVSVSSTIIPSLDTSSPVPVVAIVVPVIVATLCLIIAIIIIIIVLGNVYIFVYYYVQL